jgi:membrane fusion protein, heavy metal efflux system
MQKHHIALIALATALAGGAAGYALRGPAAPAAEEHAEGEAHADGNEHSEGEGGEAPAEEGVIAVTPDQLKAAGIETVRITDAPLAGEVIASGQIVPAQSARAEVTARTAGVVTKLLRQLGDAVAVGTPLAVIDSRDAAEAQAAHAQAVRAEALARATFERERSLFEQKVTARADFEKARADYDAARIAREASAEALRALGARPGGRGASRLVEVRSPIAGRVTAVETTPGSYVAADAELFEVADQRVVWAELSVPGRDVGRVRPGQRVDVMPQGEAHAHTGRLQFVSPAIDPVTGAAKAVVRLDNGSGELAIGKLVTARITSAQGGPSGLMVPRDALQEVEGRTVAFVKVPQGFEARTVTVRPGTADRAAVLSGLRSGEEIAVVNSFILKAELMKGEAEHEH